MITCGHCKSQHPTVAAVRQCSQQPKEFAAIRTAQPTANPATEKQVKFLQSLLADRDHGFDESTQRLQLEVTTQSRKDTSKLIDHLLTCPRKPAAGKAATLEDGIYEYENEVYRVYHTVHGANQQVVSLVNTHAPKESKKTDKFTYLGKAPLAFLRPEHKMPFDAACKIASAYEWCIACGTILHNDKSVELGIGPVCRGKFA